MLHALKRWLLMCVSSRTPEGWSGRCEVCGQGFRLETSRPALDVSCPHCGSLVWLTPKRVVPRSAVLRRWLPELKTAAALVAGGCAVWTIGPAAGLRGPELAALTAVAGLLFGRRLVQRCERLATSASRPNLGDAG